LSLGIAAMFIAVWFLSSINIEVLQVLSDGIAGKLFANVFESNEKQINNSIAAAMANFENSEFVIFPIRVAGYLEILATGRNTGSVFGFCDLKY